MKREYVYRGVFYVVGLIILAFGITLNTKTGLGVSPIISVPYSISSIWNFNFGNMTLVIYLVFILAEMILHTYIKKRAQRLEGAALLTANRKDLIWILAADLLQFPLSLVFTRFLNIFSAWIPDFAAKGTAGTETYWGSLLGRLFLLLLAIVLTGIGAAMSLNMRLVPNPGDGIVQAIADAWRKSVGFTKNCFDLLNISVTITVGLLFAGHLIGVGAGTVIAVFGVGRVIAVFHHFWMEKMDRLAGIAGSS